MLLVCVFPSPPPLTLLHIHSCALWGGRTFLLGAPLLHISYHDGEHYNSVRRADDMGRGGPPAPIDPKLLPPHVLEATEVCVCVCVCVPVYVCMHALLTEVFQHMKLQPSMLSMYS